MRTNRFVGPSPAEDIWVVPFLAIMNKATIYAHVQVPCVDMFSFLLGKYVAELLSCMVSLCLIYRR